MIRKRDKFEAVPNNSQQWSRGDVGRQTYGRHYRH